MSAVKTIVGIVGLMGLILLGAGCASIRPPSGTAPVERRILVTGYCPCRECCSWHRNWLLRPVYSSGPLKGQRKEVGMTASGTKARHGTIAADTRLFPFGTVMKIQGYGMGRVEDQGGAIKGDHIDLFFDSHHDAQEWGKRYVRVLVWSR
jgi:3D (Asp-Asp-Asp) domain-containing protein